MLQEVKKVQHSPSGARGVTVKEGKGRGDGTACDKAFVETRFAWKFQGNYRAILIKKLMETHLKDEHWTDSGWWTEVAKSCRRAFVRI